MFGLTEAPRLWLRIRGDLLDCGWTEVKAAAATFILKDEHKKLCGVLVLHVDDGLRCGKGKLYEKSLEQLQSRAPLEVWKNQGLRVTGRSVTQNQKTHEMT